MPAWPGGMPKPRTDGFRDTPMTPFSAFKADKAGVELRRRVTTAKIHRLSFTMSCTPAQVTLYNSWYWTDLAGGTLTFTYNHPRTGEAGVGRLLSGPPNAPKPGVPRYLISVEMDLVL